MAIKKKIRVFLIDDSAVMRQVMQVILEEDPGIQVIGAASDPIFAMDKLNKEWPDVIVTDVEMPRMDGITFLKKIMATRPTPIIICSTLTDKNADTTVQAAAAGAVAIITKPKLGLKDFLQDSSNDLIAQVKAVAYANVKCIKPANETAKLETKHSADAVLPAGNALKQTTERVIAIGTSTGGTQALEVVLTALPPVCPGIVIVQHMPERFTASFAARLNSLCKLEVKEAQTNDRVLPGRALIAPGGRHMILKRSGAQYYVEVIDGPPVNRHKPSVDVLFRSVARFAGKNALGIIMTGMGDDGARGLKEMHDAGAYTAAQDEKSCVVYGMPKEAVKLGGVKRILPLNEIAGLVQEYYHTVTV